MPSSAEGQGGRLAWVLFGLGWLLLPSLAVHMVGAPAPRLLDAQPGLIWSQPWRCWSAAWVHWSVLHLVANTAGTLLLLTLGWTARVPLRAVWAWALAWPLVSPGIALLQPGLAHYGGLSGVLHAGVAVVLVWLLRQPPQARRERRVGLALFAGLMLKLASERFWTLELQQVAGWDIAVVPLAHAVGTVAGLSAGWLCLLAQSRPPSSKASRSLGSAGDSPNQMRSTSEKNSSSPTG